MKKLKNHTNIIIIISIVIGLGSFNRAYSQSQEKTPEYFKNYKHLKMKRSIDGILEIRFYTGDGPIVFTREDHHEFVEAFFKVSQDRENKVVILTGTGKEWIAQIDAQSFGDMTNPRVWDPIIWEGQKILMNLLDISVPVIAAINGSAIIHSEYALTADFIIATEDAYFQDYPHLAVNIVPGDGMHVVWPNALGKQRGWYFLYTQQKLNAHDAKNLGVVAEILPDNKALIKRSYELARQILKIPELTRRYMRILSTQTLKRDILEQVTFGLALEGISATDLRIANEEKVNKNKE